MDATEHSLYSSYREALLEHLLVGELMRHMWVRGLGRLEVLQTQVDDSGYDLVLEARSVIRHVQIKATFRGSRTQRFNVNIALSTKPSGCVVVVLFHPETLAIGPFWWFGAPPGEPLPSLDEFLVAKHTKGNAQGVKLSRPNIRVLPWAAMDELDSIEALCNRLFGPLS